jgi:hypothetical protein
VQFQLVNVGTADYQDDPFVDITAKDSAGQSMQQDFMSSTTAGAHLGSTTNLAPGDKALGFETFDVPNSGIFGTAGEWRVG